MSTSLLQTTGAVVLPPPTPTPTPTSDSALAVIVFGLDDTGKPHASTFGESDVALAEKAAGLMGMSVMAVATEPERALAAKVPKGRLFASGKGFVPFIKAALYAELQALAAQRGVAAATLASTKQLKRSNDAITSATKSETTMSSLASQPVADSGMAAAPAQQPTHWANIQVGSIVLAAAAPKHTEWYECQVVGTDKADGFTLRYCDWPKEPSFVRQRHEVGLMHPSREPEPPVDADGPAA